MADKSDVIQDYLNSLNEAMAIHAKKAIEGLEFDRTETAEIVDITNRDKGEYQVFNGSIRYFAYSENTSYTLGTKVYVTIPNNDYSQQKLIKGKYKSGDNDTNISWTSPLKGYSPGTDNLIEDAEVKDSSSIFSNSSIGLENIPVNTNYDNENGDSLLTNYNDVSGGISQEPLGGQSRYASQYKVLYLSQSLYDNETYNKCFGYMGISAEFKTALSGFNVISGSYGLLILIDYYQKVEAPVEEPIHKLKVCKLDTTSMVGSVYNFNTFYKQEALYKLNNDKETGMIIDKVAILFYQDGEFRNNDNELISPLYGEAILPYNIFVKNINIKFGDDIEGKPDDIAEIYTNNGLSYDSAQTNDKLNEKLIHLKWQHKNPEPILEDDGTYEYEYELMDRNDLKDIPTDADVKLIGNIHWYTDASYTIDAYRATQEQMSIANDRLYELSEKWKYYPHSMSEGEYRDLVLAANFTPKKDYQWTWDATRGRYELDENGYYKLDENGNQIPVYQVNEDGEYILDENGNKIQATGMRELQISATGEQVLSRTIVRNAREDLTSRVSDDLAGPNWIPIDGTFNEFDIEYQPDLTRGECSVKCIIEYGPELLEENEETGEMIKTSLVDPNSSYYTIIEPEIITFKNLSWTPDLTTMDAITGVTLTVDDQTEGHYPIYNATDGRILRRSERDKLRSLKADIVSTYTGASLLNGNEILLWQVPKTNTMIDIAGTLTSSKSEVVSADNFSNIAINTTDLYNSKINKTFDVLTDKSTRNNFVIMSNRNKDTLYIPQLDNIITRFNELQSNHAQTLRNIESEYEEHNNEYMRAVQAAKTDYEASIAAIKQNAQVNILDEINKNIEETLTEKQIAAIKNIDDNVISSFTQVLSIENWFDLEGFDFDNYYYLVRFGSNVAGVNPYQGYRINEYYKRNATNNTIFCYLVKNNQIYKGNITLTFGQHGSSGTDYTFTLGLGELVKKPDGLEVINGDAVDETDAEWEVVGPAASALTVGETNFRRIVFDLYDSTNTIINLTEEQKNDIIKEWVARSEDGFYSGNTNARNLEILVKRKAIAVDEITTEYYYTDIAIRAKNNVVLENLRYIILSASVRSMATSGFNDNDYEVGPVNFIQMMPLHIRKDEAYSLNGADYITYDDKGALPQSYSDEYDLINAENEVFKIIVDGVALTSGETGNQHTTYKYYPHLDKNNKLIPCAIYLSNLSKQVAVEAYDSNNTLLYTMPLLIIQNRYDIPAINSWNGELLIDEDNNRLMAASVGAGHKDDENRFTGIIMGDVSHRDQKTGRLNKTTGLYGYESGAESFGFKSDGTAFIGKSGTGRIEFNGKDGWIQSANYSATVTNDKQDLYDNEGTKIDLNDGSIDMWGRGQSYSYNGLTNKWEISNTDEIGPATNIHLDTKGSSSKPYFKIEVPKYITWISKDSNNKDENATTIRQDETSYRQSLIQIDNRNFYLQTADYDAALNTGLRIDLKKGVLDSKGQLKINGALGSQLKFGDNLNYTTLGINKNGKSYLEMISGKATSEKLDGVLQNLYNYGSPIIGYINGNIDLKEQIVKNSLNNNVVTVLPKKNKESSYYNNIFTILSDYGNELETTRNNLKNTYLNYKVRLSSINDIDNNVSYYKEVIDSNNNVSNVLISPQEITTYLQENDYIDLYVKTYLPLYLNDRIINSNDYQNFEKYFDLYVKNNSFENMDQYAEIVSQVTIDQRNAENAFNSLNSSIEMAEFNQNGLLQNYNNLISSYITTANDVLKEKALYDAQYIVYNNDYEDFLEKWQAYCSARSIQAMQNDEVYDTNFNLIYNRYRTYRSNLDDALEQVEQDEAILTEIATIINNIINNNINYSSRDDIIDDYNTNIAPQVAEYENNIESTKTILNEAKSSLTASLVIFKEQYPSSWYTYNTSNDTVSLEYNTIKNLLNDKLNIENSLTSHGINYTYNEKIDINQTELNRNNAYSDLQVAEEQWNYAQNHYIPGSTEYNEAENNYNIALQNYNNINNQYNLINNNLSLVNQYNTIIDSFISYNKTEQELNYKISSFEDYVQKLNTYNTAKENYDLAESALADFWASSESSDLKNAYDYVQQEQDWLNKYTEDQNALSDAQEAYDNAEISWNNKKTPIDYFRTTYDAYEKQVESSNLLSEYQANYDSAMFYFNSISSQKNEMEKQLNFTSLSLNNINQSNYNSYYIKEKINNKEDMFYYKIDNASTYNPTITHYELNYILNPNDIPENYSYLNTLKLSLSEAHETLVHTNITLEYVKQTYDNLLGNYYEPITINKNHDFSTDTNQYYTVKVKDNVSIYTEISSSDINFNGASSITLYLKKSMTDLLLILENILENKVLPTKQENDRMINNLINYRKNYELYTTYKEGINDNDEDATIILSNRTDKRLQIGTNFWVNKTGTMQAIGARIADLWVRDGNNNWFGPITPKYQQVITDVDLTVYKGKVGVTMNNISVKVGVSVSGNVSVNVPVMKQVSATVNSVNSVSKGRTKAEMNDFLADISTTPVTVLVPTGETVSASGSGTFTGGGSGTGSGSGTTDVEVVTGVSLSKTYQSMWFLDEKGNNQKTKKKTGQLTDKEGKAIGEALSSKWKN